MIEELLMLSAGIATGTITGLIPGLHSNTIAFITAALPFGSPIGKIIFITGMGITHSIAEAVPTIMLGASGESAIQLLPGHRMLMAGRGQDAILTSTAGALFTIIFAAPLSPVVFELAKKFSWVLPIIIPALIFAIALLMIAKEKNKIIATSVFIASTLFGILLLGSGINEIVFALITGFYGLPGLVETIATGAKMPAQQKNANLELAPSFSILTATISAATSMLPALGPAHAAFIASGAKGKLSGKEYLMLSGGISTGNLFYSIIMLYALEKTRSGVSIAIQKIMPLGAEEILLISAAAISAAGFACAIVAYIGPMAFEWAQKIDYRKTSSGALVFCLAAVAWFSGIVGLIACISAACIGYACIKSGVARAHCMGFLLWPAASFYLK